MNDHTTGLCKVCIDITDQDTLYTMIIFYQINEAARINYDAVVSAAKRSCVCRTKVGNFVFMLIISFKECPNWECTCCEDPQSGDSEDCTYPPCSCDVCFSDICKVNKIKFQNIFQDHKCFYLE